MTLLLIFETLAKSKIVTTLLSKAKFCFSCHLLDFYRFCKFLEGSFSAVSTATIATKYSFFQVFRDLQNYLAKFSKNLQNFAKNQRFSQKSAFFFAKIRKFRKKKIANFCDLNLQNFATFSKNQLDSFVDLEKPEKVRIWLQNSVSIQPRRSLEKSDVSWPT